MSEYICKGCGEDCQDEYGAYDHVCNRVTHINRLPDLSGIAALLPFYLHFDVTNFTTNYYIKGYKVTPEAYRYGQYVEAISSTLRTSQDMARCMPLGRDAFKRLADNTPHTVDTRKAFSQTTELPINDDALGYWAWNPHG